MNVTDTSSASASLLMDLQVGGASKESTSKIGGKYMAQGVFVDGSTDRGIRAFGARIQLVNGSTTVLSSTGTNCGIDPGLFFGFRANSTYSTTVDAGWYRDAANTLAQRNGANAQAFNIYNTYTDASNYERGFIKWSGNVLEIGTEKAGTGIARNVAIYRDGSEAIRLSSGQVNLYGTTVFYGRLRGNNTGVLELSEMLSEPSGEANYAKVYALDDGAGKTKLMVRFGSGTPIQLAIEP
jgi:hypothetical protein